MKKLNAFEKAYQTYTAREIPFLQEQKQKALLHQPYRGLKILHNVPLTLESLFKIEVLVAGGADLTVTSPSFMAPKPVALEVLTTAGVNVQLPHSFEDDYDICLDCCGELFGLVTPRLGTVEITRTGALLYGKQNLSYPVISVDDSKVKYLEAMLGTGDAFVRAFHELTGESLHQKKVMVVGYGKVGQGIVHALTPHTRSIVVVDRHPSAADAARSKGFTAITTDRMAEVEAQASSCFAVVTATGRKHAISNYFDPQMFKGRYLANMGGEDEFGDGFETHEVMCNKQPINFAIAQPTLMKYLDPVFYAHNHGIELLKSSQWTSQLHPFPSDLASAIVAKWETYFNEYL